MLVLCDPNDCYGLYCLERAFPMGRSLQGAAQQMQRGLCISSCPGALTTPQREGNSRAALWAPATPSGNLWQGLITSWGCDPAPVTSPCAPDSRVTQGTAGHTHCMHRQTHPISKSISQRYHFSRQECGYDFERQPLTTQRQALCAQVLAKVLKIIPFSASLQPFPRQWAGLYCWSPQPMPALQEGTVLLTRWYLHWNCTKQMADYMTDLMLSTILCNNKFKLNTLTLPHT